MSEKLSSGYAYLKMLGLQVEHPLILYQDNKGAEELMENMSVCWWTLSIYVQFSNPPLLPRIKKSLNLSTQDVWLSIVLSTVGDVPHLFPLGPLSNKY